jgi:hypothetical protein
MLEAVVVLDGKRLILVDLAALAAEVLQTLLVLVLLERLIPAVVVEAVKELQVVRQAAPAS